MCTVSFYPTVPHKNFILTSNRDEQSLRPTQAPEVYEMNNTKVCFPKDKLAGGSWIAMNNKGRVVCLLNGGFIAHQKQAFHTHSRGKVLRDLISTNDEAFHFFNSQKLENTEPFTLITVDTEPGLIESLSEFIWDGKDKHFRHLETDKAYIWSSSTLYNEAIRKKRRKWFDSFLKTKNINQSKLFDFHSGEHTSNTSYNLIMERENNLKTVSITQIDNAVGLTMNYTDLLNNKSYCQKL